jgi:hypothetical protein
MSRENRATKKYSTGIRHRYQHGNSANFWGEEGNKRHLLQYPEILVRKPLKGIILDASPLYV